MVLSDIEKDIRKYRKRLRQIENLERQEYEGRQLSEEEEEKVLKKNETRKRLQQCLLVFAEEIEYGNVLDVSEDALTNEFSSDAETKSSALIMSDLSAMSASSSSTETYSTSTPNSSPRFNDPMCDAAGDGQGDADREWTTVGKKNQRSPIVEHTDVSPTMQSQSETSNKHGDKRPAVDSVPVKEPGPVKKQRKDAVQDVPKISKADRQRQQVRQEWADRTWTVLNLEGHNDLVSAIHLDRECLLSGSRDTTVKVWNVKNGFEEKSLGGHTDTVTAILLLSVCASKKFAETYQLQDYERLIISGSQDCSLKIWALNEGRLCRSIYTYNPITALTYLDAALLVAGTGGGKVELWDTDTGISVQSLIAHQDAITGLTSDGSMVYSSSVDGIIKVYQIRERELHIVHSADDVTCASGSPLLLRHIRSMTSSRDVVFYGDDGNNVKVLDWKKGQMHKLKNHHTGEFGSTDAMCCHDYELLTAGYDLDHGVGYLNVWSLPEEDYVATLRDDSLARIMCVSCAHLGDKLMIATGGFNLQLWLPGSNHSDDDDLVVTTEFVPEFSARPQDSDLDSDGEMSESEAENITSYFWKSTAKRTRGRSQGQGPENVEEKGWFSYCRIL